jgi:hypothetical protein
MQGTLVDGVYAQPIVTPPAPPPPTELPLLLPIKPLEPPPPTRTAHTQVVPAGIVTDVPEVIV